jgi:hypothetical protein
MLVGAEGFEPPALCSQSRCATRLRYAPTLFTLYREQVSFERTFDWHTPQPLGGSNGARLMECVLRSAAW